MRSSISILALGGLLAALGCEKTEQTNVGGTTSVGSGGAGQGGTGQGGMGQGGTGQGGTGQGGTGQGGTTGVGGQGGSASVIVYPSPGDLSAVEHLQASVDYQVSVNGQPSFVYETDNYWEHPARMLPDRAAFTYFDFEGGPVQVEIDVGFEVQSVTLRPRRDGVSFTQVGNKITFTLSEPKLLAVEINDRSRPLFLFAEKPEAPDTTAQHYFAKGVHHLGAKYPIAAGERVYLEGGAVVEGTLTLGGDDIKIGGRGILTAGQWTWSEWLADKTLSLLTDTSGGTHDSHTYSGVVLLNSPGWFANGYGKSRTISHLKVMGWVGNSDGPHLNGNGLFEHSFVFNNDDSLISNLGNNNVFRDNVVWKGPWGRPMVSLSKNNQDGLTFEDIDVIYNESGPTQSGAMAIIEAPGATKKNYVWRDIRLEGPTSSRMFYIDANQTTVSNLLVENVTAEDFNAAEGSIAASNGGSVDGVTFTCIKLDGTVPTSLAEAHMIQSGAVTNVSFMPCP